MHVSLPRPTAANWANAATFNLCHELLRHVRTCQDWLQTHPAQWTTTTIPIRILFEQTTYTSVSDEPAVSVFTVTVVYHCPDCCTFQIVTVCVKYHCILPDTHLAAKHSFTFQIFWIIVKGPFWHSSSRLSLHVPCVQYWGNYCC